MTGYEIFYFHFFHAMIDANEKRHVILRANAIQCHVIMSCTYLCGCHDVPFNSSLLRKNRRQIVSTQRNKTIIQLCVSSDVTRQSNSCFVSLHLSVSCAVLLARDARNASYSSSWLTKNHESFSCGQQERLARSSGQHGISYGAVGTA